MSEATLQQRLLKLASIMDDEPFAQRMLCEAADELDKLKTDLAYQEERGNTYHLISARRESEVARLKEALERICAVDYETHEALQSTCIDIARQALRGGEGEEKK